MPSLVSYQGPCSFLTADPCSGCLGVPAIMVVGRVGAARREGDR